MARSYLLDGASTRLGLGRGGPALRAVAGVVEVVDDTDAPALLGAAGVNGVVLPQALPTRRGQSWRVVSLGAEPVLGWRASLDGEVGSGAIHACTSGVRVWIDPAVTSTVTAPSSPVDGDVWATKRVTGAGTVTYDGNGSNVEGVLGSYAATWADSTAGAGYAWEYWAGAWRRV